MRIQTHGNNLIQLSMAYFPCNCYLVREADGFTLVDTAIWSAKGILAAAQQFGSDIQRITLTHDHSDHVGSLDALHALLPAAEVSISARDVRFLRGDMSLDPNEPQDKLRGGYVVCKTTPNRLLNAGDRVGSLEVIASPGHTPGHVAFFDRRDNTLIAGDAFSTQGGISTAGTLKLLFPLPAAATWSKATGLHSAEALVALNPSRLATGHGRVLDKPVQAMEQAIAEAKSKLGGDVSMPPRRGVDQALVVQTAVQLADTTGFEAVTLAAVAEQLGIRIPSLYNHVAGLPGLRSLMSLWAARTLLDLLRRAAVGKAGADAITSMAAAYRAFAHAHPGVYRLTLRAADPEETDLVTAAQETLELLFAALRPYDLDTEDTLHTIRAMRSVLHGFIDLEILGGFGMALDRDESFQRLIRGFIAGIEATKREGI